MPYTRIRGDGTNCSEVPKLLSPTNPFHVQLSSVYHAQLACISPDGVCCELAPFQYTYDDYWNFSVILIDSDIHLVIDVPFLWYGYIMIYGWCSLRLLYQMDIFLSTELGLMRLHCNLDWFQYADGDICTFSTRLIHSYLWMVTVSLFILYPYLLYYWMVTTSHLWCGL